MTALRESQFIVDFFLHLLTRALRGSKAMIDLHLCDPDFLILNNMV